MSMQFDIEEINRLIHHRRSVFPKMYTGEKVDNQIIRQILENANMAPTHKLTEPWRFMVFTGNGLRKLADFQAGLYKEVTTKAGNFKQEKYESLKTKPLMASHVIAIIMKRDEHERLPEIEEIEAVACAVQNMYLTATAYEIGCYWGTGGITYMDGKSDFFKLGPKDRLLGFFYIGVPKKWPRGKRHSVINKTSWISQ